ncbi:MAG: PDZ domain-containing protein [Magnetococcus sp. DMHC-6]
MKLQGPEVVAAGVVLILSVLVFNLFDKPNFDTSSRQAAGRVVGTDPNTAQFINTAGQIRLQTKPARFITVAAQTSTRQPPVRSGAVSSANIMLSEGHWQGLEALPLTAEFKQKLNLPNELNGLLIDEVSLVAAACGLLAADVLVAVNGRPVTTLEELVRESRRVSQQYSTPLTVVRQGQKLTFYLQSTETLGFAQVETAPMIPAGAIVPHPYRGPCTQCHAIGNTGHITPDPDGIILPPPPIKANAVRPHQDRGSCQSCHTILN